MCSRSLFLNSPPLLAVAVPEASRLLWQGHAKLRWVRRLGCLPKVLCCHCWVLSEWPHSVEGNSFPKHWHPAGDNSTLLIRLAHFNSNEFIVWVFFVLFGFWFLVLFLLLCLSDVFISWAKQQHWETWTRKIHSLRTSDDGQT